MSIYSFIASFIVENSKRNVKNSKIGFDLIQRWRRRRQRRWRQWCLWTRRPWNFTHIHSYNFTNYFNSTKNFHTNSMRDGDFRTLNNGDDCLEKRLNRMVQINVFTWDAIVSKYSNIDRKRSPPRWKGNRIIFRLFASFSLAHFLTSINFIRLEFRYIIVVALITLPSYFIDLSAFTDNEWQSKSFHLTFLI